MGESKHRLVRSSPQRSQWLSVVLAGGAVAAVAAAFAVAGVDHVEVLATLFFAPVFVAALLGGRNIGYGAAAAVTLGYLALRYGDIGDSGALPVAVLVVARGVCYAIVVQATPTFQHRFLGLPDAATFGRNRRGLGVGEGDRGGESDRAAVAVRAFDAVEDARFSDEGASSPESEWGESMPVLTDDREPVPVAAGWMDPPATGPDWGPPTEAPAAWGPLDDGSEWGTPEARPGWDEPAARRTWSPADTEPAWADPEPESVWDPPSPPGQDWGASGAESAWDDAAAEPAASSPEVDGPWGRPMAGPAETPLGTEAGWGAATAAAAPGSPWGPSQTEPPWSTDRASPLWDDPPLAPPPLPLAPDQPPVGAHGWDGSPEPGAGGWADPPAPSPAVDRFLAPPAPTVPTGWVDDATVPLGDETIPLGYTGELFLPRDLSQSPAGSPPVPPNGSANGGHRAPPFDPLGTSAGAGAGGMVHDSTGGRGAVPPVSEPPRPPLDRPPVPAPTEPGPPPGPSDPLVGVAFGGSPGRRRGIDTGHTDFGVVPASGGVDPETRLWNARFFRDRLTAARDESHQTGSPFSVVMVQVSDQPFQTLPYRRQVALLRELGHQFIQARMIDHLVHLPDGGQHWFAVVLPDADRSQAHALERRLRGAIASYLRSRGLHLGEVQSASLTSPDDDQAMSSIWASLLGSTSVR